MSALPLARLFGFEIRVHVSWAFILAVIVVTVAAQVGDMAPTVDAAVRWIIGGVIAAAFLASAVAHELGHALAARRAGLPGGSVTVFFFGGAASPVLETTRARDEMTVAAAGPAVSLVIGVALLAVTGVGELAGGPLMAIGRIALVIGAMNVILGAVNLLPAYPLDGGRIVRGFVWSRSGDADRGLRTAGRIGRWLGIAFGVIGLLAIITVDSVDGLMLAVAGWFLVSTARTIERSAEVDRLLEGISVGDVMERDVSGVPPGLTLDTFGDQLLTGRAAGSVPVVRGAELLGMIGAKQLRRIRRDRWALTRAEDLMISGPSLPLIGPEMTLRAVLDRLHRSGLDGLPVMEAGALAGIVTRRAVADAIRDRMQARSAAPT